MKTIKTFYLALFLVFSFACSSDDEPLSPTGLPVTVEFPADISVMEEADNHEIFINFNRPATSAGVITVKLKSGEGVDFETVPAMEDGEFEIDILKGDTRASFFFIPGENGILEENKSLVLELTHGSKGFLLGSKKLLNITITEDDQAAKVDFNSVLMTSSENNPDPIEVEVDILGEAPGEGTISIELEGEAGELFTTTPALDANNRIDVTVPSGATKVSFQILLKDDAILKAHHNFVFRIIEASGAVTKGDMNTMSFTLLDDELFGKPKSSETVTADGKIIKTLEYDALGRISKVKTESFTPHYFGKTETYNYNENGQLEYITLFPGDFDRLVYANGKVVKIEEVRGFFLTAYKTFEYNAAGKVSKKTGFEANTSGDDLVKEMYSYTYFPDGNLNTETYHIPGPQDTWKVVTTRTYSTYNTKVNPFPLEVMPNLPLQHHFAGMMDVEENGQKLSVYYALDYNPDGFVAKRRSAYETVTYTYY